MKTFIIIGRAEAISFLVLLLIAMPLKYVVDEPLAVKYTGWAHGLLFVLYMAALAYVGLGRRWRFGKMALLFLAAFVPGGPFIAEHKLLKEETN